MSTCSTLLAVLVQHSLHAVCGRLRVRRLPQLRRSVLQQARPCFCCLRVQLAIAEHVRLCLQRQPANASERGARGTQQFLVRRRVRASARCAVAHCLRWWQHQPRALGTSRACVGFGRRLLCVVCRRFWCVWLRQ